jgi:hypothetical protein
MNLPEPNAIERPRSVAEIIGEALDIYQRYPIVFLTLALAVIAPYQLIVLAATGTGPLASSAHEPVLRFYLLLLIDSAVVSPLVSVLHIHAVQRIGAGERPRLGEVALRGLQVLPVAVAAVIVSGAGIALGFLALIVPGILLAMRWAVVAQVAAIEHEGWIPSLRRSAELTRTHYLHIFGLLFLVGVVTAGVTAGARAIPLGSTSDVASIAVGIAVRTITASFAALTVAILYFDLRARATAGPPQILEHEHLRDLDPSPSEDED